MIAHSFRGAVFGPAQELHGATFVVRAAFFSERLDENGIVVDIGRAHDVLKAALKPLNYRNLDDLPQFKGVNTTTEFLTRYVYDLLADAARSGGLGRARRRTVVDPGDGGGIAERAGLVRGPVAMKQVVFAVPGDLATPTGGYVYDRRIVAELPKSRMAGRRPRHRRELSARRRSRERATAHLQLAALPAGRLIVVDGLAFGVMPDSGRGAASDAQAGGAGAPSARARNRLAGLGGGEIQGERASGIVVCRIASSRPARPPRGCWQADFAVPAEKMSVVLPGNDRVPLAAAAARRRRQSAGGRLDRAAQGLRRVDRRAWARSPDLPWRLVIAADPGRSPDTTRALEAQIASLRSHRPRGACRRGVGRAAGRALCKRRSVRAAVALRRLRHGLYRGDRARRAGDRDDRGRDPGGGARRRRRAGARRTTSASSPWR